MIRRTHTVAVIGGGPAGLMAAEVLAAAGLSVDVYDRMPSLGRKFLMAGRGGLNLTHSEALEPFTARYGAAAGRVASWLTAFKPEDLIAWAEGLGQPTFVGSSGRVFPKTLKASPLLRAWLARLDGLGVRIHARHEWLGWDEDGALRFGLEGGGHGTAKPDATLLALGGASWPRLGSNGAWKQILSARDVAVEPFQPANSGFQIAWSDIFRERFAGQPLKAVALSFGGRQVRGEVMVAGYGLEGGAIYALSAALRDAISATGSAGLTLDLRPDQSNDALAARLGATRRGETLTNRLRKAAHLSPLEIGLLREAHGLDLPQDGSALAAVIKAVPLTATATRGLDRAISTAGGVALAAVDDDLRLRALPGVWLAGEMLDWEAPTGGYLLQASFASGVTAARGVLSHLTGIGRSGE